MKIIILCVCAFLALCEADIKIQTKIFDVIPDNSLTEISMNPFIRIGDNYYMIEAKEKLNWFDAQYYCRRKGADLATIETAEEMQALSKYLLAQNYEGYKFFWLSGNNLADEDMFSWMGNGQPMTYTNWDNGEPNNKGGREECVQILKSDNEFKMNDNECHDKEHYICEINGPKIITYTVW